MKKINHWINGKNVAGNEYFHTTNPATGEVLAEVASGGEAEIGQAVEAAKAAFPKWANLPMKERARLMRRLGDLIDQNVPEIAAMETADTGLPIHQTKNVLIPRASHNFEFFAEVCQQMNGKTYPVDDKMLNYTLVQPVGVCALVSPWNVPFMTATWKVAPCLALGNTAVLKMSELSPLTADRLGELALEAGIPAGVLNVVQGYGATAGDALVRHQDVRAVSFTGGTATGRRIMHARGAGGDLRAGGLPAAVQGRSGRAASGQRRGVRPGVLYLDPGRQQGAAPGAQHRGGHGVRQHPERARPAPAVRRREGLWHRA